MGWTTALAVWAHLVQDTGVNMAGVSREQGRLINAGVTSSSGFDGAGALAKMGHSTQPKGMLSGIQHNAQGYIADLNGQIQALTSQQGVRPLTSTEAQNLAELQRRKTAYSTDYNKFVFDAASKYGASNLGLGAHQAALLGTANSGTNGINFGNIDIGTLAEGDKTAEQNAGNQVGDAQKTADASAKASSDQATQAATDKTASDASAAALKTTSDANQTMWDQASAHAADLVNTGLNTFDTALQGKKNQASSLASTEGQQLGLGAAQAGSSNAQTNLQAKGAANRATLGSDLGSQAGTYLAGVAGQETDNAEKAQGVNAQGKIDLQNRNAQNISTKIDQLRQSGQIAASGQEQQIDNLLKTYQNDNTSAENKQKIGGQIIGLVLGGVGAAASAAIMA